jgi:hypothetical protein
MRQVSRSTELQEHISEIYYFLNFFAQTQLKRLEQVPADFVPCWIEPPEIHCNVHSSIQFLCFIFIGRINCISSLPSFNQTLENILFDEILVLMNMMTDYLAWDLLFRQQENLYPHNVWLVVSRLCKIALSFEDWSKYQIDELSFEYFVDKYAYPFDSTVD